jgi:hypothetical protein
MGPPAARTISQEAFDELVNENIDDLGMDPDEALEDAIQTLTLQGADLSGENANCLYSRFRSIFLRSDLCFFSCHFLQMYLELRCISLQEESGLIRFEFYCYKDSSSDI